MWMVSTSGRVLAQAERVNRARGDERHDLLIVDSIGHGARPDAGGYSGLEQLSAVPSIQREELARITTLKHHVAGRHEVPRAAVENSSPIGPPVCVDTTLAICGTAAK